MFVAADSGAQSSLAKQLGRQLLMLCQCLKSSDPRHIIGYDCDWSNCSLRLGKLHVLRNRLLEVSYFRPAILSFVVLQLIASERESLVLRV